MQSINRGKLLTSLPLWGRFGWTNVECSYLGRPRPDYGLMKSLRSIGHKITLRFVLAASDIGVVWLHCDFGVWQHESVSLLTLKYKANSEQFFWVLSSLNLADAPYIPSCGCCIVIQPVSNITKTHLAGHYPTTNYLLQNTEAMPGIRNERKFCDHSIHLCICYRFHSLIVPWFFMQ